MGTRPPLQGSTSVQGLGFRVQGEPSYIEIVLGLSRDNGKENGKHCLGFRILLSYFMVYHSISWYIIDH